jgi:signal transduction histidine kinase
MWFSTLSFGASLLLGGVLIWVWRTRASATKELKDREEQLAAVQQDLVRCSRQFDEFKTKLAHDIRGPLQSAMGYADLLEADATGPLNPKQKRFLEIMRATTPKILDIIDQAQAAHPSAESKESH